MSPDGVERPGFGWRSVSAGYAFDRLNTCTRRYMGGCRRFACAVPLLPCASSNWFAGYAYRTSPIPMLYLASKSPRRRELLGRLGVAFGLIDLDIPEQRRAGEPAVDYVVRVAGEKARAGLAEVVADPDALVLGSDTEVILDDEVFGKPADADDARAMLQRHERSRLAGRAMEFACIGLAASALGLTIVATVEQALARPIAQVRAALDGQAARP